MYHPGVDCEQSESWQERDEHECQTSLNLAMTGHVRKVEGRVDLADSALDGRIVKAKETLEDASNASMTALPLAHLQKMKT